LKAFQVNPSQDPSQLPDPVDALFSRWTELTDLYATQLVLWEHGDLSAFQAALELAPEIEQLRQLISGDRARQVSTPSGSRRTRD
jgi:hypothetical protein